MPWPDGFAAAVVGFVSVSCHKAFVGASSLAMVVNDNAGHQIARVVLAFIASRLAPTEGAAFPCATLVQGPPGSLSV
jgi:hypothetical protein